jgi:hypothetical protein
VSASNAAVVLLSKASGTGQEHMSLRSPWTPSMCRAGGQYLVARAETTG